MGRLPCRQRLTETPSRGFQMTREARKMRRRSRGQLRYAFAHPRADGSTHRLLDPLDLIEKLTALVPALAFTCGTITVSSLSLWTAWLAMSARGETRSVLACATRGMGSARPSHPLPQTVCGSASLSYSLIVARRSATDLRGIFCPFRRGPAAPSDEILRGLPTERGRDHRGRIRRHPSTNRRKPLSVGAVTEGWELAGARCAACPPAGSIAPSSLMEGLALECARSGT
jgi:hypothetical protein